MKDEVLAEGDLGSVQLDLPRGVLSPVPPPSAWIGNVLNAATWVVRPDSAVADAAAARAYGLEPGNQVVVILVDGLGEALIEQRLGYARTLRGLRDGLVHAQTCSPSTTAAAITSFTTGALPGATRMVGYAVANGHGLGAMGAQHTMNLLNFAPGVDPYAWQPIPTMFECLAAENVEVSLITRPKFAGSGLTLASFRGAHFIGRESLQARFDAALANQKAGSPIQVVYWSDIDHVGHRHGPSSNEWAQALEEFDTQLGQFLQQVSSGTTVVLTADHGMVDVEDRIDLAANALLSQGVSLIAGEGRALHVHAEPGCGEDVVRRWSNILAEKAWVFGPDQFPQILGNGSGCHLVGDALVMMKGRSVIVDSRVQSAAYIGMQGVHGSLTWDEMSIPVWRLA